MDVLGSTSMPYGDETVEFGGKYARMSMFDAIKHYNPEHAEIQALTEADLQDREKMVAIAKSVHVEVETSVLGHVVSFEEIFCETAEPQLIQPTFITGYPADISPLARRSDDNPFFTDRFEFFIGGRSSERLPLSLTMHKTKTSVSKRVNAKDAGDDEAMYYDADYITALEHGLPPTAGQGIGIDRLAMLFTNTHTIRDVILFPAMSTSVTFAYGS
ncbi:hypothetical protein OH492_23545 [Vibrio chagasii]|nr:hypothetical protein [Vibrio chagasii]